MAAALAQDEPAEPKNLVRSPSFEEPAGLQDLPPGWEGLHTMPPGTYQHEIAADGRTGEHSLTIEGRGEYGVAWGDKLPIDRALRYRARGYVRIEGDERAAADVKLHYYGANEEYLGQSRVGFVNPRTPGWQLITVTDELDRFPDACFVGIAVALAGNGKAGFDDIELHAAPEERGSLNYVSNGDMEDVAADRPAGYFVFASEGGTVECRTSTEKPHGGRQCLAISSHGDWAGAGSVQVPVDRQHPWTLTGWVRVREGTARISLGHFDADGRFLGSADSEVIGTGEWRQLTASSEFATYPRTARINAVPFVEADSSADFDDLVLAPRTSDE